MRWIIPCQNYGSYFCEVHHMIIQDRWKSQSCQGWSSAYAEKNQWYVQGTLSWRLDILTLIGRIWTRRPHCPPDELRIDFKKLLLKDVLLDVLQIGMMASKLKGKPSVVRCHPCDPVAGSLVSHRGIRVLHYRLVEICIIYMQNVIFLAAIGKMFILERCKEGMVGVGSSTGVNINARLAFAKVYIPILLTDPLVFEKFCDRRQTGNTQNENLCIKLQIGESWTP